MPLDMKNIDHFLKFNTHNFNQIANFVNNIDKNSNLLDIYSFLKKLRFFNLKTNSRIFANLENNGDYLTIPIMFIPFKNEEDRCYCCENIYSETPFKQKFCMDCLYWCITNYATSSLSIKCAIDNLDIKSLYKCYDNKFEYIIKCHGITKNLMTNKFMFIMKYANGEYVTKEYEFDINDIQRPSRDFIIENSNSQQVIYTSKPLSKLISEINPSGKRNIEDETQANGVDSKHVKISDEINPESQE
ncbi:hypothetical protein RhiirB3_500641 [Rhizophagus irregularis]|nr:hypothetical protein RhiirB3_500641 [Rhizophagus irregularis]